MTCRTEVFLEGLRFGESPRWHDGRLWFSDFYDHAVCAVDENGAVERICEVPQQPSGLGWLPDGRLLAVSMLDQRLLVREPGGALRQYADLSALAAHHANDLVVDAAGRAYVGNFGFDLDPFFEALDRGAAPPPPVATVLIRVDPDGAVSVAAKDLLFPNGAVITPDGRTLIVAETFAHQLTAFTLADDGALSGRRVWAEMRPLGAVPDGICLDAEGAVWTSNPLRNEVLRIREGGEVAARVTTTRPSFACMLGGAGGRTLFVMTAETSHSRKARAARSGRIETVPVDVPGAGRP